MSTNAEPVRATREAGNRIWAGLTELQKLAVIKAISAYADAPGTDERIAMLHAVRAYVRVMGLK